MSNKELKTKYADAKKRLHICTPVEIGALKMLMNYYYGLMMERNIA